MGPCRAESANEQKPTTKERTNQRTNTRMDDILPVLASGLVRRRRAGAAATGPCIEESAENSPLPATSQTYDNSELQHDNNRIIHIQPPNPPSAVKRYDACKETDAVAS